MEKTETSLEKDIDIDILLPLTPEGMLCWKQTRNKRVTLNTSL